MTDRAFPRAAALLLAGLTFACSSAPEPPTTPAAHVPEQYAIADFLDTTNYAGGALSPDKSKVLVSSNATGIFNAYAIPVEGGDPVALTDSESDSIFALGYFPSDERFLYTSDQGGNELNHVFVRAEDGSVTDLTPGEGLKARFLGWAQDDQTFFVGTNEREPKYFDVYEYDGTTYERTLIYQNDDGLDFAAISPDRRYLALSKTVTNADNDVYLLDRENGTPVNITPDEGAINVFVQQFDTAGESLYMVTDRDSEFTYLVRYDLADGSLSTVETADWDIAFSAFTKSGRYRVTAINRDGRTELRLYDGKSGERIPLPEVPDAEVDAVRFSRDETMMTFYASTSRTPRDLYVQTVDGGTPRKLTHSLSEKIATEDLVEPEVVRFASYDGVEVPGILYKPHQASADNPVPALVWVHGGPGGQSRVGYSALIQYIVNHGYGVFAINNRGSSGYGKTFFHMDDKGHGRADLDDCVASKKMLAETGWIDADRIGIAGGSYGGYMTLAALAFRPEEFDVGVDVFGVANWYRTLNSIPPWWTSGRAYFEAEFGPLDDEEYLKSISPLFHAENIRRPLIVLQGANDPRVLQVESDEMVAAVEKNGVPVEYIVFEDEGHGFRKKENQAEGWEKVVVFLDRYLKGEGLPSGPEPTPVG